MRQCRPDELKVGEALYGSVVCLGVVVLNGMTMKWVGGERLCDNCPKGNFGAQRQSPSACLDQCSNVMLILLRQPKQSR